MNIANGYACSFNDLLVKFPYDKLKSVKGTKLRKKLKIKKVFEESIKMVLLDIIDNNSSFILPSMGSLQAELHLEAVKDSDFEEAKRRGRFKDVDFLESLFTGYQLFLYLKSSNSRFHARKKKPVYVNKFFKDLITKNTNEGKQYS